MFFVDHYSTCSAAKNNEDKEKNQKTLQDMFTRAKKRKAESEKKVNVRGRQKMWIPTLTCLIAKSNDSSSVLAFSEKH